MEDRAGGDRFLVVAAGAFVNARTLLQVPCLTAAAPRTDVAARPPQAGQVFEALFLGAEARHEFEEPVHPILRHHPTGMLPQREQLCKNIRRTCFSWIGRPYRGMESLCAWYVVYRFLPNRADRWDRVRTVR